jgi:hypothetical protein
VPNAVPKAAVRVWDLPCARCGHVTMRYHAAELPKTKDSDARMISRLRYLDGSKVDPKDVATCSECNEDHLPETFVPRNWQEYKDFDPDMLHLPTHGHPKDSPFSERAGPTPGTDGQGRLRV